MRFLEAFDAVSLAETLAGRIVLSVGSHRRRDEDVLAHLEPAGRLEALERLSVLHQHKIDLADEILVINVGESTRGEVEYARSLSKKVRWLEPDRSRE